MPKVKQRKKSTARKSTANTAAAPAMPSRTEAGTRTTRTERPGPDRTLLAPTQRGVQSLIIPGMVTLGCWGMAFSFVFLSTDPNHVLFGGMAALMGLLWTISFVVRMRKIVRRSQIPRAG